MLLTIVLSCIAVASNDPSSILPAQFLAENGYTARASISARRHADNSFQLRGAYVGEIEGNSDEKFPATVTIRYDAFPSEGQWSMEDQPGGEDFDRVLPVRFTEGAYSNISLGGETRRFSADGDVTLEVKTAFGYVSIAFRSQKIKLADGRYVPDPGSLDHLEEFVESLARQVIARGSGERLSIAGKSDIDGHLVTKYTGPLVDMYVLSDWCLASGYAYEFSAASQIVTVRNQEAEVLLPLGSRFVIIGAQLIEMADVVAIQDGLILVPISGLDAIDGGD